MTYRASLGTRGELRRIAAEAESVTIDHVRPWIRKVQPCRLAPHVIVPQWIRLENPVKPKPPPRLVSQSRIASSELVEEMLESATAKKFRRGRGRRGRPRKRAESGANPESKPAGAEDVTSRQVPAAPMSGAVELTKETGNEPTKEGEAGNEMAKEAEEGRETAKEGEVAHEPAKDAKVGYEIAADAEVGPEMATDAQAGNNIADEAGAEAEMATEVGAGDQMVTETEAGNEMTMEAEAEDQTVEDAETGNEMKTEAGVGNELATEARAGSEIAAEAGAGNEVAAEAGAEKEMAAEAGAENETAAEAGAENEMATEAVAENEMATEAGAGNVMAAEAGVGDEMAAEAGVGDEISAEAEMSAVLSASGGNAMNIEKAEVSVLEESQQPNLGEFKDEAVEKKQQDTNDASNEGIQSTAEPQVGKQDSYVPGENPLVSGQVIGDAPGSNALKDITQEQKHIEDVEMTELASEPAGMSS